MYITLDITKISQYVLDSGVDGISADLEEFYNIFKRITELEGNLDVENFLSISKELRTLSRACKGLTEWLESMKLEEIKLEEE